MSTSPASTQFGDLLSFDSCLSPIGHTVARHLLAARLLSLQTATVFTIQLARPCLCAELPADISDKAKQEISTKIRSKISEIQIKPLNLDVH